MARKSPRSGSRLRGGAVRPGRVPRRQHLRVSWLRAGSHSGGKVLKRALANLPHLESRTRCRALVVMRATMLARRLADCWRSLDVTVEEGLEELKELCTTRVWVRGQPAFTAVPQPRASTQALLSAAGIDLPAMLPAVRQAGPGPNRRKKLPSQRRERRPREATVGTSGISLAEP